MCCLRESALISWVAPPPTHTHLTQEWEEALSVNLHVLGLSTNGPRPICLKVKAPRDSCIWATVQGAMTLLFMSVLFQIGGKLLTSDTCLLVSVNTD